MKISIFKNTDLCIVHLFIVYPTYNNKKSGKKTLRYNKRTRIRNDFGVQYKYNSPRW